MTPSMRDFKGQKPIKKAVIPAKAGISSREAVTNILGYTEKDSCFRRNNKTEQNDAAGGENQPVSKFNKFNYLTRKVVSTCRKRLSSEALA